CLLLANVGFRLPRWILDLNGSTALRLFLRTGWRTLGHDRVLLGLLDHLVDLEEGLPVGVDEIDDQPRRLVALRIDQEGLVDEDGAHGVKHDTGFALVEQAVAVGTDEAPADRAEPRRKLEVALWQIDDDAKRIGQDVDAEPHGVTQIGDEPGAFRITG